MRFEEYDPITGQWVVDDEVVMGEEGPPSPPPPSVEKLDSILATLQRILTGLLRARGEKG